MTRSLCLLLLILPLAHCNQQPNGKDANAQLEEITTSIRNAWDKADAPGELKKLQQLEYKVVELPADARAAESALNNLGSDRWDCRPAVQRTGSAPGVTVFCKRGVETPLRFIPRTF